MLQFSEANHIHLNAAIQWGKSHSFECCSSVQQIVFIWMLQLGLESLGICPINTTQHRVIRSCRAWWDGKDGRQGMESLWVLQDVKNIAWFVGTDFSDLHVEGGEEDDQGRPALLQVLLKRQGQCSSLPWHHKPFHPSFFFSFSTQLQSWVLPRMQAHIHTHMHARKPLWGQELKKRCVKKKKGFK